MELSKTTLNFAEKRNIELFINEEGVLDISVMDEECCTDCSAVQYVVSEEGDFTFQASFSDQLEDLPYWIRDEKHLREVIEYVAETLN